MPSILAIGMGAISGMIAALWLEAYKDTKHGTTTSVLEKSTVTELSSLLENLPPLDDAADLHHFSATSDREGKPL